MEHKYNIKTYNGRVKIYIDEYCFLAFNQLDFRGWYAFKDDHNLFGIEFYLCPEKSEQLTIETFYKTKENWLGICKILDKNL